MNNDIVDYTASVQTYLYEENGVRYAFTIYDDFYPESCDCDDPGLEYTGNKKVLAITPKGTLILNISKRNGRWIPDEEYQRDDILVDRINEVLFAGAEESAAEETHEKVQLW
jgi:hypothetical protein